MHKTLGLAFVLTALGAATGLAATGPGVVIGDSLGVGVSMASHLRSFAKNSVSIRGGGAIEQIERAEAGSTVFLSLGTNDAVGNVDGLDAGIQKIVDAAAKAQVHLVWMGPPCVFKPWNKNALTLDAQLKKSLDAAGVVYVSMQDEPRLCDRSIRAPDGVHFSMTGYNYMWQKAREAAGFTAQASDVVAAAEPKAEKHKVVNKTKRKKRRKAKRVAAAPETASPHATAPASEPQNTSQ